MRGVGSFRLSNPNGWKTHIQILDHLIFNQFPGKRPLSGLAPPEVVFNVEDIGDMTHFTCDSSH